MDILNEKKDKIEIQAEEQQKKEIKLLGSKRKIPGLKLWEINLKDYTYKVADFAKRDVELNFGLNSDGTKKLRERVIIKDNCVYIQKLREKSLLEFLKKNYNGIKFNRAPTDKT